MSNLERAVIVASFLTRLIEEAIRAGEDISDRGLERGKRLMEESHEDWNEAEAPQDDEENE